jgi:uncharacterized membrane protein YjgN (DUF898 family)
MTLDVAREGTFQQDGGTALDYDGKMGAVAGITALNAILALATLGIYRFWGTTRLRRYIWSRIEVFGDSSFNSPIRKIWIPRALSA